MRFFVLFVMFLFFGAVFLISNENLRISDKLDREKFYVLYYNWLGNIFFNFRSMTSNVIRSSWLPVNNSAFHK